MQIINKFKWILWVISLGFCVALSSCKKYLEIPPPINQITKDQLYTDSATIASSIYGMYSDAFQNHDIYVYMPIGTALTSDEMSYTSTGGLWGNFAANSIPTTEYFVNAYWTTGYAIIYQANNVLENLPQSKVISEPLKQQFMAEARFLRALQYLDLVLYFGDVPLVLTTDLTTTARLPRMNSAVVFDTLIADLKAAEAHLPAGPDFTRGTKSAAQALLARAYLYRNDWANANAMATKALSGPFKMEQDLDKVFLRGTQEAILQISSKTGAGYNNISRIGVMMGISTNVRLVPTFILPPSQLSAFEPNDLRVTAWIFKKTVNGTLYNCPYKYKLRTASTTRIEEQVVLRVPEQMLIKAEALAQLNDLPEAKKYIDTVRTRSGLAKLPATLNKQQLLDAIEKERRAELFTEGDRWFYLNHIGKIDAVLQGLKPGYEPFEKLFPIPQNELKLNNALTQNTGYN